MGFIIGRQLSKDDATEVRVHYRVEGENQIHVKKDDIDKFDSDDVKHVAFFIVPLTGKAQREISDRMMSVSRKGKTQMQTGTAEMIRVLKSVIHIEGMNAVQGRAITRMDESIYDACPRWMLDELLEAIHKLNGTDTVEDEDGISVEADTPFDEN